MENRNNKRNLDWIKFGCNWRADCWDVKLKRKKSRIIYFDDGNQLASRLLVEGPIKVEDMQYII